MARYKNGITGPFSGKVGPVVGSVRRGTHYMRSLPEQLKREPSISQLESRMIFALVMAWLKPLAELIKIGFQSYTGAKTPMNGAVSHTLSYAVCGEYPEVGIDYSKAIFSRGELFTSIVTELVALGKAMIRIAWENALYSVFNQEDDLATIIAYCPGLKKFAIFEHCATRDAAGACIQLPAGFEGQNLHCWLQYVDQAGKAVSTTAYIGEVRV